MFKQHYANFITLTSLLLGLLGIFGVFLFENIYPAIAILFISAFLDFLDGKVARMLKIESVFGEFLDSFNDILTFGILPMTMLCFFIGEDYLWLVLLVCIFYMFSAVFRLSSFHSCTRRDYYTGLPITAAAVLLNIVFLLHVFFKFEEKLFLLGIFIFTTVISICMVSSIKIKKSI